MEQIGTGAGQLKIYIQIGSVWTKDIIFRNYSSSQDLYSDESLTGATFSFFVKKFKGDRIKLFNLTLNNGISFVTYYDNVIRVTASATQTSIEEGEYYFELRRTDLDKAKISGLAYFVFDSPQ
jgi:hypothetical protein